ncbi:MAG TPA: hypothetical protein P5534_22575, partial [Candidatus Paceibacterota bacterium]|nr:hypothetical protein [Candidatus Paceibacterota bacterium]
MPRTTVTDARRISDSAAPYVSKSKFLWGLQCPKLLWHAYYHPDQEGSASMKAVLPALTGRGYDGLAIQEGGTASLELLRITFGAVGEDERQRVRRQLEEYCGQDTEGMIWIVDALRALVGSDAG